MKNPFEYQKPSREQTDRIERVRAQCAELHETILTQCPQSRERSVAITNLEQVSMWANKAIVMEESA